MNEPVAPMYSVGVLDGSLETNNDENYINEAWDRGYELVAVYPAENGKTLAVFKQIP